MNDTTVAVQKAKEPAPPQTTEKKPEHPLDPVNSIFEDIARRAFGFFESEGRMIGHDIEHWFKAERELLRPVSIELTEKETAFEIKAEVPGFTEKELEINVEPRRVVIAGTRESRTTDEKKGEVVRSENRAEQMLRVVELPSPIETSKVTAALLKNGILTLKLPKVALAQPVRIKPTAS
jgi:HSP20 family protein